MGIFCSSCTDAPRGRPVIINMDKSDDDNGLYGSLLPSPPNIPDFDTRKIRTRFDYDLSKRSPTVFVVKPKTNKITDTPSKTKTKYALLNKDHSDTESDTHHEAEGDGNKTISQQLPETDPEMAEKRNSNTTIVTITTNNTLNTIHTSNTINTISTVNTNYSTPATIISVISHNTSSSMDPNTALLYSQSDKVHAIDKKHAFLNAHMAYSADSAMNPNNSDDEDSSSSDEYSSRSTNDNDHEAKDHYDDTALNKWQQHWERIPRPDDLVLSQSSPMEYGYNVAKHIQFPATHMVQSASYTPDTQNHKYSISLHEDKPSTPITHNQKYHFLKLKNTQSAKEYVQNMKIHISEPKEVDAIFYQLTSIKELDNASQINVILDEFLTDYHLYDSAINRKMLPYKYLFGNDIIGNLIFAWNFGVKKINSTLITYSIQSLCKFTHRDEFRRPFLAQHGINLIDKTLSIPSLQPLISNKKRLKPKSPYIQKLSSIVSTDSVDFASNSFGHILAVLKITRDICRLDVIDTMLWCSSKIYQKVLSTMKRDYDEERITRACRDTLVALLDASYEIGEEIITDEQIHHMIDSFLDSTKTEYLHQTRNSVSSLQYLAEKASIRSDSLLPHPLFVYNNESESKSKDDLTALSPKHIIHAKRKNFLQLEQELKKNGAAAGDILNPDVLEDPSIIIQRQMSTITDITERSEYETDDDYDEEEEETDTEEEDTDTRDKSDESQNAPIPTAIDAESWPSMVRLPSTSHMSADGLDLDDAASMRTHICNASTSEAESILSLQDYDAMVEEAYKEQGRMSDIDEAEDECKMFSDYDIEEKCHTTEHSKSKTGSNGMLADVPSFSGITMHSINIDEDDIIIDIALKNHQLLYINSLFHILYKIITLKKAVHKDKASTRPTTAKSTQISFMELLQNRKKQDRKMSGGTAGGLSQMDAAYMSDSDTMYRQKHNEHKLKQINHEKNKLLESFFQSLSFKNLFKLLKYYRLSTSDDGDGFSISLSDSDDGKHGTTPLTPFSPFAPFSPVHDVDNDVDNTKMMSIEKLACKILRKTLSYSQIVTDRLLIDDELDVIGILVTLLFRNPSNIDLIIYILDIFSKISKDNEDIRDLLLSPEHFDKFLRALDPWWMIFIKSTQKLDTIQRVEAKKRESFLHLKLMKTGVQRMPSVDSIGVADDTHSKGSIEPELHIEVTIAMLKFFNLLSQTNALDMVEYGVNDRILVLLDYYVKISATYDSYNASDDAYDDEDAPDTNVNYTYIFSNPKHQQCLSLCLECIQNLATDINMLLEFVVNGTVEKLSVICWSFRDHSAMIKKCCEVINKLLKLEQSCKQITNQNVLQPLISAFHYIFKKCFIDSQIDVPELLIASVLFPDVYTKVNRVDDDSNGSSDKYEEYEEYEEDDDEEDEDEDDEELSLVHSDDTIDEEERYASNKAAFERRVRFDQYDPVHARVATQSMSFSMNSTGQRTSGAHHGHLRDLKNLFNVLVNISYVDTLCIEIIESDLMLLLIECIANDTLLMHKHMMISLVVSDLMQHLTKNKKGAHALIHSTRFEIAKYIVNAIENNLNNRGVVLKYFRALMNLKDANHALLKQQLIANKAIHALKNVSLQYRELINVDELVMDNEDNEDKLDEYNGDSDHDHELK